MESDKSVMLVAQKNSSQENPKVKDLYEVGSVSTILQLIKLPDGTYKVLVEGIKRAKILSVAENNGYMESEVEVLEEYELDDDLKSSYLNTLQTQFKELSKTSSKIRPEVITQIRAIERLEKLIDNLVGYLSLQISDRQKLLEEINLEERAKYLVSFLENQLDLTQMEKKIRDRVKKQMEKSQKDYYLSEQMKALKKEMGDNVSFQAKTLMTLWVVSLNSKTKAFADNEAYPNTIAGVKCCNVAPMPICFILGYICLAIATPKLLNSQNCSIKAEG